MGTGPIFWIFLCRPLFLQERGQSLLVDGASELGPVPIFYVPIFYVDSTLKKKQPAPFFFICRRCFHHR